MKKFNKRELMEEATAREFEKSLQLMRLKVIKTKNEQGVEGLRALPSFRSAKEYEKKKEKGENE